MLNMRDELVQAVARSAGLAPAQAGLAVTGMLRFLAARLPSPLFGELQSRLDAAPGDSSPATGAAPAAPASATKPHGG
ncbi:MAG: hypothetical protein RIQ60_2399 [Pseudomonadota bacterium]|jgi:hypothetical protein